MNRLTIKVQGQMLEKLGQTLNLPQPVFNHGQYVALSRQPVHLKILKSKL